MGMNLRKKLDFKRVSQLLDPVQEFINVRFHEEAAGTELFNDITYGIQSDNLDLVSLEILEDLLQQALDHL
ncbi:hypothetical protein D3C87_2028810 [compost metagenome]